MKVWVICFTIFFPVLFSSISLLLLHISNKNQKVTKLEMMLRYILIAIGTISALFGIVGGDVFSDDSLKVVLYCSYFEIFLLLTVINISSLIEKNLDNLCEKFFDVSNLYRKRKDVSNDVLLQKEYFYYCNIVKLFRDRWMESIYFDVPSELTLGFNYEFYDRYLRNIKSRRMFIKDWKEVKKFIEKMQKGCV